MVEWSLTLAETGGYDYGKQEFEQQMAEILNSLTDEQKEKAKACKTPEELTGLLGELGVELPDKLLDAVAGGQSNREISNEEFVQLRNQFNSSIIRR